MLGDHHWLMKIKILAKSTLNGGNIKAFVYMILVRTNCKRGIVCVYVYVMFINEEDDPYRNFEETSNEDQ